MTFPASFPGNGSLGVIVSLLILATASAFTTGLIVEDDLTAGLRSRIWARFPYTGSGAPPELDGSAYDDDGLSPGSYLGNMLTCVRCFGVYSTGVWCVAWWAVIQFPLPDAPLAARIVVAACQFAGACQVQRWWNARTARTPIY